MHEIGKCTTCTPMHILSFISQSPNNAILRVTCFPQTMMNVCVNMGSNGEHICTEHFNDDACVCNKSSVSWTTARVKLGLKLLYSYEKKETT